MTDRKAMEQALEALKNNAGEMRVEGAINILECALAQSEQEPVDVGQLEYFGNSVAYIHQKMTAYRNSIDAAWAALWFKGIHPDGNTSVADAIKEYVAPPRRTWAGSGDLEDSNAYLTPTHRQPLTDEECDNLWAAQLFDIIDRFSARAFIRDVEAAHGIKGEA